MDNVFSIYTLLYTMGEMLITTWPGRFLLCMAVGSVIARLARA
jgi:hypothetical protein